MWVKRESREISLFERAQRKWTLSYLYLEPTMQQGQFGLGNQRNEGNHKQTTFLEIES